MHKIGTTEQFSDILFFHVKITALPALQKMGWVWW